MDEALIRKGVRKGIRDVESIDCGYLDVLAYGYRKKRDIDIEIEQPEFTSLCPLTGLPDFGRIIIRYTPDSKIVELKSLKYYLLQYRNVGIFYEHLANKLLEDLVAVLQPKRMEIKGVFTARGGITTNVTAQYPEND
ncbi:MAG: NADPH-dependent 7-cyano-7-deazaguanine reductase QueF [Desulfobacterales bacterium]|jgi:7-cyano-7-deazaguanine reductase|nr:NADPH-dependent 7-cyano-7-deazaguanine reductase QueF [Desulfobacterales bacterium]